MFILAPSLLLCIIYAIVKLPQSRRDPKVVYNLQKSMDKAKQDYPEIYGSQTSDFSSRLWDC